jgi:hypothetical protein
MNKIFLSILAALALAGTALAEQKIIKDPAEYNAYMAALNTPEPVQKAAAMVAFVAKYHDSVMHIDALEQAMAAYQQAGDQAKVEATAGEILKLSPDNVRALAIVTFLQRHRATKGDKGALKEVGANAERGLKALETWPAPDGMSDEDFKKLRGQMADIFNGAAGFAALKAKDYATARGYYLKSVSIDPANMQDVYQLAIADLQAKPLEVDGFWYIAKAINLASAQKDETAQENITNYGQAKYRRYHGSDDGWDALVAAVASQTVPPNGFAATIKRAPTPAELAVKAVMENDPASLSFSDYEYVLSYRDASPDNKTAAKKVWDTIQAKQKNGAVRLALTVKVIEYDGKSTMRAAITDGNQQANKADLEITLKEPLKVPVAVGSQAKIIGVLSDYKLSPFMFLMKDAELGEQSPAVPASKP